MLALAITIWVFATKSARDNDAAEHAAAVAGPSVLTADGALRFGNPAASTVITVTEDANCPDCTAFENASAATLTEFIDGGAITVDYDIVAVQDSRSSTEYSSRAANASACVAADNKDSWRAWHTKLLGQTPDEGAPGRTNDELTDLALQSGAGPGVRDCVNNGRYRNFVEAHTKDAVDEYLTHTPMVRVNGAPVENITPDGLRAAIERSKSAG